MGEVESYELGVVLILSCFPFLFSSALLLYADVIPHGWWCREVISFINFQIYNMYKSVAHGE